MPVLTLNNNVFRITDVVVDIDEQGHFIRLNLGHCDAVVLCVSKNDPVSQQDLVLSEADLQSLFRGGRIQVPEKGYSLQGVSRQQIAGASQYRNFTLTPPAYVQVWGMKQGALGAELLCPEDMASQTWQVPVGYNFTCDDSTLRVQIRQREGYSDGDLMYRVAGHLAIPIPKDFIGLNIPLRPGTSVDVIPAPHTEGKYVYKTVL